jgi:putative ABC transport system permease protein
MPSIWNDVRYALRQLRKSPGFTTTAVLTLALGIGVTTAIFTLVHQVMLKSLPVTKPEELWRIGDRVRCCNWGGYTQGDDKAPDDFTLFSYEAYQLFRTHTPEFTDLAAMQAGNQTLGVRRAGTSQPAQNLNGEFVSGNFFRTFGSSAWAGRVFTDADNVEGAQPVAVMSHHVWQQKYAADPSVIGSTFQINGHPFTIVGVTPPGFYGAKLSGGNMPDLWLPLSTEPLLEGLIRGSTGVKLKSPNTNWLDLIGRVRSGTNPKALEAKLRVELHDWLASHVSDMGPQEKETWQKQTLHLVSGGAGVDDMRQEYGDGLKLLLAASGCVLLIACANIANLLLARGLKDRHQNSVRAALGASPKRLVYKALVESITLGIIGGLFGIAVAYGGTRLMLHLAFGHAAMTSFVPVQANPSIPVLLFALAVSVLTGVLFGVAPAWIVARANPVEALRGSNRSVSGKATWPQKALVVTQAALSLVLLSAAVLLGQSLRNLEHQKFGFDMQGRYVAWINPELAGYKPDQLDSLFRRIQERLRAMPGVRGISAVLYAPMSGDSWNSTVRMEGKPEPGPKDDDSAGFVRVTPGFFETLGDRMLMGRPITDEDTATTRKVAVINEAFAKRFFKGENPIGKHFGPGKMKYAATYEVVGVVANMRYMTWNMKDAAYPMFFLPEAQTTQWDDPNHAAGEIWSHYLNNIILWAPGNPPGLESQVRKALGEVDPNLVLYSVDSYASVLDSDFSQQNMIATLTSLFGLLALVLAAIGLYGVTAYSVEQRTTEIGIRMALGANRSSVMRMVLSSAFVQVAIGLVIGIPAAIGAGYAMSDQLFSVKPWDPVILVLATLLLALAAFIAAVVPSRRAASIEPMQALRME